MRKLLFVLALFSAPAYAEDDIIAKARAELEATQAINRANEARVIANNEALIKKYQAENDKFVKEYGAIRSRPQMLRTYVVGGRYIGSSTVVCVNGRCYQ